MNASFLSCGIVSVALVTLMCFETLLSSEDSKASGANGNGLNLGVLEPNSEHVVSVKVRNKSSSAFVFDQVIKSCGCLSVAPSNGTIEASDSIELKLTIKSGDEPGHFGASLALLDSKSGAQKQMNLVFDVVHIAQVNSGAPIRVSVDSDGKRSLFSITSKFPNVDLRDYSVSVVAGCLKAPRIVEAKESELKVEAAIDRSKVNENDLSVITTFRLQGKNKGVKQIPDLEAVVEFWDGVKLFPSRVHFHEKDSELRATLLIEVMDASTELSPVTFKIMREHELVATAEIVSSRQISKGRRSFVLSLGSLRDFDGCDSMQVWVKDKRISDVPLEFTN